MKKKSLLLTASGLSLLMLTGAQQTSATLTRFIQIVKEDDADTRFHLAELEAFEVGVVPDEEGFGEWDGLATSTNDIGDGELTTYGDGEFFPDIGTTDALEHGGGAKDPNNDLESGGGVWSTANNLGENAQYTLDLGAEFDVTTVRMWPRADTCCSNRWENLVINLYGDNGGEPGELNATEMHTENEGNVALEFTFLASVDTDGDGMPDGYETAHGLDPEVDDGEGDLDGDGISNFDEFENGTLPEEMDTDGDGLQDSIEIGLTSLTSSQEVPAPTLGDATPSGWARVTMNAGTREVTISGTYSGTTSAVSAAHLHGLADPGTAAGVLFGLTASGGTAGTIQGSGVLSEADFAGFLAGRTYINVHTANNGAGEIRGQVNPSPTLTDPLNPDTDEDKLSDGVETNTGTFVSATDTGTNPLNNDTDGDGFRDGLEVAQNSNPTDENSVPAADIPPPLAYYDFEDADISILSDGSGNGFDGDVVGSVTLGEGAPAGSTPTRGGQFSLDGAGFADVTGFDWFELVHDAGDGDYTLACWLKPDVESLSGDRFIWGQTSQGVHNGVRGAGTLHTAHWGADSNAETPLEEDVWVHAVWVYNGADDLADIYLNGVLDLEGFSQRAPNGSGNLILGGRNGGTQNFIGCLDDMAIWAEALREDQVAVLAGGESPAIAIMTDTDEDGIPDFYEIQNELNNAVNDAGEDKDGDGLTNLQEYELNLKANNADTDGDTLSDKVESNTGIFVGPDDTGTNPRKVDTDGDDLPDNVETNTGTLVGAQDTGTNPLKQDTDDDGFRDPVEIANGSDPNNKLSVPNVATVTSLGTGTESLLGMDLTDPEDDGDEIAGEDDPSWNWVSIDSNDEPGFEGGEFSYNIFDNTLGPGNAKWCCSNATEDAPLAITIELEDPVRLSHFTISSANDVPGRDPLDFQIQGSNDGETFEPIFIQESDDPLWTERLEVILITLPKPSDPYKFLRYEVTRINGAGAHQLGEIEYFGQEGSLEPFQIREVTRVNKEGTEFLQVTWPSSTNGTYAIETGVSLDDDWTEVEDGFESQGETTTYELELDPVPAEIYIRIREEN